MNVMWIVCLFVLLFVDVVRCTSYPPDFVWGAGTASYQIEGGVYEDGRVMTIWDRFSHTPGKTALNQTGDVADDSYHRWRDDIQLMKDMQLPSFRFSIAWSRVLNVDGTINLAGVAHYNDLINALIEANITPFVTLYHWDLPQHISDGGGWTNADYIVPLFTHFATVCFDAFGDRVKDWITFNEPGTFCLLGYDYGAHAPGRCSNRAQCEFGNSTTEPYECIYSVNLAHAYAVNVYRTQFAPRQAGRIGMTISVGWPEPLTDSEEDLAASERSLLFDAGAYSDPIVFGDWNDVMKERAGPLLRSFTDYEKSLLRNSVDFYALNHYGSTFVGALNVTTPPAPGQGWDVDRFVYNTAFDLDGQAIGEAADSPWLLVVPWGLRKLLIWLHDRYKLPILITENGVDVPNESYLPLKKALSDDYRIDYLQRYIHQMELAMDSGVQVKGYFAWSLLDSQSHNSNIQQNNMT